MLPGAGAVPASVTATDSRTASVGVPSAVVGPVAAGVTVAGACAACAGSLAAGGGGSAAALAAASASASRAFSRRNVS